MSGLGEIPFQDGNPAFESFLEAGIANNRNMIS